MTEILIKVDGVSKKFCRTLKKSLWYGLQDLGSEILGRCHGEQGELRQDEFWAVNDVSFELKRGECLGLIGKNGAGKTTLLKMLNGLIKPDGGRIEICGRVGALIALGAGFNPILTGRENIYVNASVLGLSRREIDEKIDEIIDFAGIGEFINTPVQNYSSGMQVRLGFAVASTFKPDILLIDEVLAVGDGDFKIRCINRIRQLLSDTAIIFVSHSMERVSQICTEILVMERGVNVCHADVATGIAQYNQKLVAEGMCEAKGMVYSDNEISELSARFEKNVVRGSACKVELLFRSESSFDNVSAKLLFWNVEQKPVLELVKNGKLGRLTVGCGTNSFSFCIDEVPLTPGRYELDIHLYSGDGSFLVRYRPAEPVIIEGNFVSYSPVSMNIS